MLENGIDMFFQSPIWGYGYGAYSYIIANSNVASIGNLSVDSTIKLLGTTSNQFLQILVESGIFGLFAFIYLLYGFYKISFFKGRLPQNKFKDLIVAISGWVIVFPLTALTATWVLPGSFSWILMCILIGISYRLKIVLGVG